MAKMKIFSPSEKNAYESPPVFNSVERKRFFALPIIYLYLGIVGFISYRLHREREAESMLQHKS